VDLDILHIITVYSATLARNELYKACDINTWR